MFFIFLIQTGDCLNEFFKAMENLTHLLKANVKVMH